jgi:hypothetical protein
VTIFKCPTTPCDFSGTERQLVFETCRTVHSPLRMLPFFKNSMIHTALKIGAELISSREGKELPTKQSHYSWEANSYTWELIASRCRLKFHVLRTHVRLHNKGAVWQFRKCILPASTRRKETEDKCHAMDNSLQCIFAWTKSLVLERCIGKWTELTIWNTCNDLRFRIYRTANVRNSIQIFLQQSLHKNGRN